LSAIGEWDCCVLARLVACSRTRPCGYRLALSASLGGLLSLCLLVGPVVIHEMSVTSRPSKITLDAVVATSPSDRYRSTNGDVSTAAASSRVHPEDHDYIEVFILNLVSATLASLVIRWIHLAAVHSMDLTPCPTTLKFWRLGRRVTAWCIMCRGWETVLVLNLMVPGIRQRLSRGMVSLGAPVWLISIFFRLSWTCAWVAEFIFSTRWALV
jgi:hypothetical protein